MVKESRNLIVEHLFREICISQKRKIASAYFRIFAAFEKTHHYGT